MKVSSFQGTILLQSSFPYTLESRFVLAELAWIPAPVFARACFRIAGMTDPNRYLASYYHFAPYFRRVTKSASSQLRLLNFFVSFVSPSQFGLGLYCGAI